MRSGGQGSDGQPLPVVGDAGRTAPSAARAGAVEAGDADPHAVARHDVVERARRHDPPVVDDDDAVADPLDLGEQVRVEDHRRASVAGRADDRPDVGPSDRVERRCRFVEEDEVGRAEQRDAEAEPLLHPLGEPARPRRPPDRPGRRRSRAWRRRRRPIRRRQAGQLGVEQEHLTGAQPWLVAEELRQVADPAAGRAVAERGAEDPTRAARRTRQAEQQLDRRGLPGAVRPQQADELARTDLEVDPVERHGRAVAFRDRAELDDRR